MFLCYPGQGGASCCTETSETEHLGKAKRLLNKKKEAKDVSIRKVIWGTTKVLDGLLREVSPRSHYSSEINSTVKREFKQDFYIHELSSDLFFLVIHRKVGCKPWTFLLSWIYYVLFKSKRCLAFTSFYSQLSHDDERRLKCFGSATFLKAWIKRMKVWTSSLMLQQVILCQTALRCVEEEGGKGFGHLIE